MIDEQQTKGDKMMKLVKSKRVSKNDVLKSNMTGYKLYPLGRGEYEGATHKRITHFYDTQNHCIGYELQFVYM